jgi:membrane protease YdiL (CAAX protease family)
MPSSFTRSLLPGNVKHLAAPAVIIVILLYFLVNGSLLFGDTWGVWQNVTTVYIFFVVAAVAFNKKEFMKPTAPHVFLWFAITFIIALIALTAVFAIVGLFGAGRKLLPVPVGAFLPTIVFQIFVVTYSEEIFFRGFLAATEKKKGFGIIVSSFAFAVFHFAAYSSLGFTAIQFIQPLIAGVIFGIIYQNTEHFAGTGINWGLHAAYNITVLGLIAF